MNWTWLAELPTTNARISVSILMTVATGSRVIATGWDPPTSWLGFLLILAGIDAAQFTAKRLTYDKDA
jgi:hypothetical protein